MKWLWDILIKFFGQSGKISTQNTQVVENKKVFMISMEELLGREYELSNLPQDHQDALAILLERANKIRSSYASPMTVSSGYRSMDDHLRIYREKAAKEGKVFDETQVPKKSKHLFGQAVDIYDPDKKLQKWCKDNETFLVETGVWIESFSATPNWVHFQIIAPGSGSLYFMP